MLAKLKTALVLVIIGGFSGLAIWATNEATYETIIENARIKEENFYKEIFDLDSDFEITARVIYLGQPRTSTTFLGLFRRETTTTEVRVVVELKNKKTGNVVSGNGTGTIDRDISSTGFQINEELPFDRSELGGALKEAIGNAVQEIL